MRRTRTKTNAAPVSETWQIAFDGGDPYIFTRETTGFTTYSVMSDGVHGNAGSRPPRPDSGCAHVKMTTSRPDYIDPPLVTHAGAGLSLLEIDPPGSPVAFPPDAVPGPPSSIVNEKFDRFLDDSLKAFVKQFDERVSIANFLYELKDFKNVLKEAKMLFRGRYGQGGSILKNLWGVIHDRLEGGIGGNYLDLKLNWESFISDLPKVLDAYSVAMKRLKFLVEHQNFTTHRRVRFQIPPYQNGFDDVQVVDLSGLTTALGVYSVWLKPAQCQVTFNASAYIDNHLQLEDINAWWAIADVLGLNNSPKIVWNAVKLSWVADMFVDTTDFLDAFEVEAYAGKLVYRGGNASYKIVRFYDIVIKWPKDIGPLMGIEESVVGELRVVDYLRTPTGLPNNTSFLGLKSELSTQQKALLVSLGDANAGVTSKGFQFSSAYAANFRKNLRTFGKTRWKRVARSR